MLRFKGFSITFIVLVVLVLLAIGTTGFTFPKSPAPTASCAVTAEPPKNNNAGKVVATAKIVCDVQAYHQGQVCLRRARPFRPDETIGKCTSLTGTYLAKTAEVIGCKADGPHNYFTKVTFDGRNYESQRVSLRCS